MAKVNLVIAHDAQSAFVIRSAHHEAPREDPDAALEDAHIYVHLEAVYILAPEKGRGECDGCQIGAAQ